MLRARENDVEWRPILDVLSADPVYERRLDAVLELTLLPECHLYLTAESGDRFHLERSRRSQEDGPASPAVPRFDQMGGSGAEEMAATAALELLRTHDDESDRVVATLRGRFYSLALRCADDLIGLLHIGPLVRDDLSTKLRRHLESIRFPLALVIRQAHRERSLTGKLAALSARAEAGRRLQVSALDLGRFIELLLDLALKATRTEAGFIAIGEPGSEHLTIRAQVNLPAGFVEQTDLSPATGLFDWSPASEGGALTLRDFDAATRLGIRSLLAVPLVEGSEPVGIFGSRELPWRGDVRRAEPRAPGHVLRADHADAPQRPLVPAVRRSLHRTVKGLARALDVRRAHTHGHHGKVARVAERTFGVAGAASVVSRVFELTRTTRLLHIFATRRDGVEALRAT